MSLSQPIISADRVSKCYRLGLTLDDLLINRMIRKCGSVLTRKQEKDDNDNKIWALRDVSFEVNRGEVVGIIGRNGAGKSTFLKILSRITEPTTGEIRLNGRVSSLLEVGTGFHPELTGAENVFLNGSILGMRKNEIERKYNEIIEFAEIRKFVNTPVKRYSSGMYVRLAFAVAAHLEPEILVVDEVLSVGDAEFQRKAIGKMQNVSAERGRTVLFVSHNMGAIAELCDRCLLLEGGSVAFEGSPEEAIKYYLSGDAQDHNQGQVILKPNRYPVQISKISLRNQDNEVSYQFEMGKDIIVEMEIDLREKLRGFIVSLSLSKGGVCLLTSYNNDANPISGNTYDKPGRYVTCISIPMSLFKPGTYKLEARIGVAGEKYSDTNAYIQLEVINTRVDLTNKSYSSERPGFIYKELEWVTKAL